MKSHLTTLGIASLGMGVLFVIGATPVHAEDVSSLESQAAWWSAYGDTVVEEGTDVDTTGVLIPYSDRVARRGAKSYKTYSFGLEFDTQIVHLVVGESGFPCEVHITGVVSEVEVEDDGEIEVEEIGTLWGEFNACPSFQPLPGAVDPNLFGIPAGTVMPRWDGFVDYSFSDGTVYSDEGAFIFPTNPSDPLSPLGVLSTAVIDGGTGAYKGATGYINTPDGYDNHGSLLGKITLVKK